MNREICAGALLIFARAPRVGAVKSRLARIIGAPAATGLYRAMLRDTLSLARVLEARENLSPIVVFTPHDAFASAPSLGDFWTGARVAQSENDLGQRMSDAANWAFARGAQSVFLIGTDAPDLPPTLFSQAAKSLESFDAVAIPARDGGFVLWGARRSLHDVFGGVDWTQNHTLAPVLANAARRQLTVETLASWSDVDEWDDVRALWTRLQNGESVAPETERWLRHHRDSLNDWS